VVALATAAAGAAVFGNAVTDDEMAQAANAVFCAA